jgi:hypothetical protein
VSFVTALCVKARQGRPMTDGKAVRSCAGLGKGVGQRTDFPGRTPADVLFSEAIKSICTASRRAHVS